MQRSPGNVGRRVPQPPHQLCWQTGGSGDVTSPQQFPWPSSLPVSVRPKCGAAFMSSRILVRWRRASLEASQRLQPNLLFPRRQTGFYPLLTTRTWSEGR